MHSYFEFTVKNYDIDKDEKQKQVYIVQNSGKDISKTLLATN